MFFMGANRLQIYNIFPRFSKHFCRNYSIIFAPSISPLRKAAFHRHDPGEGGHILGPWRKDKQQTEFSADLRIKGISFGGSEKNV